MVVLACKQASQQGSSQNGNSCECPICSSAIRGARFPCPGHELGIEEGFRLVHLCAYVRLSPPGVPWAGRWNAVGTCASVRVFSVAPGCIQLKKVEDQKTRAPARTTPAHQGTGQGQRTRAGAVSTPTHLPHTVLCINLA